MDNEIHVQLVTPEEADEWLSDMLHTLEGHDVNVIGTIMFMLEDLTEFITQNELRRRQFIQFVEEQHGSQEAVH
jgi:hypothetical protein